VTGTQNLPQKKSRQKALSRSPCPYFLGLNERLRIVGIQTVCYFVVMQNSYNSQESTTYLQQEKPEINSLHRMARFGANIADAYGCYIFLPPWQIYNDIPDTNQKDQIVLAGAHSLSNDLIKNCSIEVGHGLIGWVAKHKRSIHVSPFERDSRTLGLYHSDQSLKSFIGIPIFIESENQDIAGVMACDSKKSFAFSKLQGKLLEDLACEISSHLRLNAKLSQNSKQKNSWQNFLNLSSRLSDSIGRDSIEILRIKVENYAELEKILGSGRALAVCEQLHRLIEQSVPAQFPFIRFGNGDLVIALDNMMTSFIENKILALSEHCACPTTAMQHPKKIAVKFSFQKQAANARKNRGVTVEELIQMTSEAVNMQNPTAQTGIKRDIGLVYEYKRA
jgi:GAF domain-containing protein